MMEGSQRTQVDELNVDQWVYESSDHENVIDTQAGDDAPLKGSGDKGGGLGFGIDDILIPRLDIQGQGLVPDGVDIASVQILGARVLNATPCLISDQ